MDAHHAPSGVYGTQSRAFPMSPTATDWQRLADVFGKAIVTHLRRDILDRLVLHLRVLLHRVRDL